LTGWGVGPYGGGQATDRPIGPADGLGAGGRILLMAEFDTVIRGGTVIDGSRYPRRQADIGVKGGRIVKVGRVSTSEADQVLDATGLIVAPGFVDTHTHFDAQVFWDPYCSIAGWHGVTSLTIGNCGFGFAPVRPELRERSMQTMLLNEGISMESMKLGMGVKWDRYNWETFPEFLDTLDQIPKAVNILPVFPVNPLLWWVMGFDDAKSGRAPTADEKSEMRRLFNEALDVGAWGWGVQRFGKESGQPDFDGSAMASDLMSFETAALMQEVLAERDQGFMQITGAFNDGSVQEGWSGLEELAMIANRPLLYSVIAAPFHRAAIAWLKECRDRSIPIVGAVAAFDVECTSKISDLMAAGLGYSKAWHQVTGSSDAETRQLLQSVEARDRVKQVLDSPSAGPRRVIPWSNFTVHQAFSPEVKQYEGWKIGDVARVTGKHYVDVFCDLALADDLRTDFYYLKPPNREQFRELFDYEYMMPGISDGGAHTRTMTLGRWGTDYLAYGVRELGCVSLEEAHWRLSALPAMVFGLTDRGILREGAAADMVMYDYDHLQVGDVEWAEDYPGGGGRRIRRPSGYRYIMVNGQVTIEDDKETNTFSGQLVRRP
jgi:N-acyl-D-amino-acid deacylase